MKLDKVRMSTREELRAIAEMMAARIEPDGKYTGAKVQDLTMPEMTGMELAGKLLKIRPGTPIILCTGYNDVVSPQEAQKHGIRQLLLKPVGAAELKKTIHQVMAG